MSEHETKKPVTRGEFIQLLSEAAKRSMLADRRRLATRPTVLGTAAALNMHRDTLFHWLREFNVDFKEMSDSLSDPISPTESSKENPKLKPDDALGNYEIAEKKVFVIIPFEGSFDDVWKGGIEPACKTEGFACLRVDEVSLSTWITEDMKKYLEMADVVIADTTKNNPNVMFELGWALAKGKKPIVIRQEDDPNKVPFDVHGIRYISYLNTWRGVEDLYERICLFLRTSQKT